MTQLRVVILIGVDQHRHDPNQFAEPSALAMRLVAPMASTPMRFRRAGGRRSRLLALPMQPAEIDPREAQW